MHPLFVLTKILKMGLLVYPECGEEENVLDLLGCIQWVTYHFLEKLECPQSYLNSQVGRNFVNPPFFLLENWVVGFYLQVFLEDLFLSEEGSQLKAENDPQMGLSLLPLIKTG